MDPIYLIRPPMPIRSLLHPTARQSRFAMSSEAAEVPKEEEAKPVRPAPRYSQPLASGASTRPQTAAPHSGLAMAQAKPSPNASCNSVRLPLPVLASLAPPGGEAEHACASSIAPTQPETRQVH